MQRILHRVMGGPYDVVFHVLLGKSATVASRFAGSLSSVGIPAHFVHAAEWIHGDLGQMC